MLSSINPPPDGSGDLERVGIRGAAIRVMVGGIIAFVAGGIPFAVLFLIADTQLGFELTDEDGLFEWMTAGAFLVGSVLQFVLFWRSDVPKGRRLVPFMRRNPFFLGLALVLFFGFGEEISWGQRIFGWETPSDMIVENLQGETNIHNLVIFQGGVNMHRLFNVFWLTYGVLVPISAVTVAILARLYRRISLPIPPLWIGGLFLGSFLVWRTYYAVYPEDSISDGQEIFEALRALCFVALGLAQLGIIHLAVLDRLAARVGTRLPARVPRDR